MEGARKVPAIGACITLLGKTRLFVLSIPSALASLRRGLFFFVENFLSMVYYLKSGQALYAGSEGWRHLNERETGFC